jgi:hypothetical protein
MRDSGFFLCWRRSDDHDYGLRIAIRVVLRTCVRL